LLTYFARTMPDGPWTGVIESLGQLLGTGRGYAMDWVSAGSAGVKAVAPPIEPTSGQRETVASGSYDAIRVYLWLGIADPGTHGVRDLLSATSGMGVYTRDAVTPPEVVDSQGTVLHAEAPVGFSAAIIPYLQSVGMKSQAKLQQNRLVAAEDPVTGLYGHAGNYYDQNLALFSTAWSEHRYRFDRDGKLHVKWK
jgi:endo-1,4-beta-D-glucanase Y